VVLLVIVVALVGLLQLPPVATAVVRKLLTLAPLNPGNRLEVGRVSGNFLRGLTLEDVRLRQANRTLADIRRLEVGYRLPQLRPPVSRLDELDISGGRIVARRQGDRWDLLEVLRKSSDTTGGGGFGIARVHVRDVGVAAESAPDSVTHLQLQELVAHDLSVGDTTLVGIDALHLAVQPPGSGRWLAVSTRGAVTSDEIRLDPLRIHTESSDVSGRVVLPRSFRENRLVDRLDVRLAGRPLDLADLAAVAPSVPPTGQLRFDASAAGEGSLVTAHLAASLGEGSVTFDGGTTLEQGKPTSYRIHGVVSALDPSRLSTSAPAGSVNARVDADLDGPLPSADGTARIELGGSQLGSTRVRQLDLSARFTQGTADLTLRGALDTGSVAATGRARPFDSIPTYRLAGTMAQLPGTAALARALAGQDGNPVLLVAFRVSGKGLSTDSAAVHGRVDLTAARDTGSSVSLGYTDLRLADGRLELRPELQAGGGIITAVGRVAFGNPMSYEVRDGRIERVDLARLAGDSNSAPLSGRFDLSGLGTAPAEARLTAGLHLDELRYGARRMERVDVTARLAAGRLRVEGQGALQGGRLVLQVLGRPFDSTASYVLRRAALEEVDLGTFMGRPGLAGPVSLAMTGEARMGKAGRSARLNLIVAPSRMGRLEITDGLANVRLAGHRLDYDASLQSRSGALSVAGDGTPGEPAAVYRIREGRLRGIDLGALFGKPDLRTDLNSSFSAEVVPGSADSLRASLALVLLPSRVNQAELTDGGLEARVIGDSVEAKLRAAGPDVGVDASVGGGASETGKQFAAGGTLRIERLARWTGRKEADGRAESRFALQLETDSAGLRSVGGTVDALGGVGDVRVPALHLAMRPADGELRLDTVVIRSNIAVLDGGGRVRLRAGGDPGALRLRGSLGDLAPVAALMGKDTVGFDSARVNLAVSGPAYQWKIEGGADAYALAVGGNLANRVTLAAAATLDSSRIRAVSGDLRVKDAAYGHLSLREVTAVGGYDSTVALDLSLNVADSVRVGTRIRGAISKARDTVHAELQQLTLDEGGRRWALERPASFGFGPRVEVHQLALRAGARSIEVNGVLDRHGPSDMTLRVTSLDLAALRAAGLLPVSGRVNGNLRLSGPAVTPRLEGKLGLTIVSRGGRDLGTVGTDLDWTAAGLRFSAAATPLRGGPLTATGTLPYRLTLAPKDTAAPVGSEPLATDSVAIAVRADSFDLALFQPLFPLEVATGLHGRLQADARIGGTMRAAQATGRVALTGGALKLSAIRVAYEKGELDGRLEGDALRIERLRLLTGKDQELTATGSLLLKPLSEPSLNLTAGLRHFQLVNSDELQTSASGRVQVSGTLLEPVLTGDVQLDRTNFFVGAAAAQAKVEKVELTPAQLRELARDFGPSVLTRSQAKSSLMDRVKLDLGVQMPRQVWLRRTSSPKTDIELMGRLRVTQQPGQGMQFFGHVEPVPDRGTIELSGRQFRLTEGDINLNGPVDSTKLDVNASYQVPTQGGGDDEGVVIDVHAKGRLDSLGLEFTADPPMSQDDILSYIVTGRPTSDNPLFEGQGGGGAGKAGEAVALTTLSSAISNAAGQGLGFDVFQIRQEPTRGLTLTAGRYLGSRLFLDLQLPLQLGSQSQDAPGSNLGPGFELEYVLQRWLRANLRGGSLPPGLLFRARRAY
jgi:translocation and assembly module TamB